MLRARTDLVGVLRRKIHACRTAAAISDAVRQAVLAQYAAHKSWSVQLQYDNLVALADTKPELKPVPSYPTLRRFMKANGLDKRRHVTSRQTNGADGTKDKLADREIRGYGPSTLAACGIGTVITDRRRCSPRAASG